MAARPPGAEYNDKKYPECGITSADTTPELHPDDEATDARAMNEPASFVVNRLIDDSFGGMGQLKTPPQPIVSFAGLFLSGYVIAVSTTKTGKMIGAAGLVLMAYSLLTSAKE